VNKTSLHANAAAEEQLVRVVSCFVQHFQVNRVAWSVVGIKKVTQPNLTNYVSFKGRQEEQGVR
jgi:hypothetical protein